MLNNLPKIITRRSKTVGRGYGSGKGGHTIGKGTKGHKSRSGYKEPRHGFEGGQMPLSRRIPKLKGFTRRYLKIHEGVETIRSSVLNRLADGDTVTLLSLKEAKLVSIKAKSVKIVLKGDVLRKLNVEGVSVSVGVQAAIEKNGGSVK